MVRCELNKSGSCRGDAFNPWSRNKDPHATQYSQKINLKSIKIYIFGNSLAVHRTLNFHSLPGELRSCKPHGAAKKIKKANKSGSRVHTLT